MPPSPTDPLARFLPAGVARRLRTLIDLTPGLHRPEARTGRMATTAFAVRILSAGLAYVSQMLLARWLGGFEYGVFVVLWTVVGAFGVVFACGFEQSVVTLLRRCVQEGDAAGARGLVLTARFVAFVVATLFAALGCAVLWLEPGLVADHRLVPIFIVALCLPAWSIAEIQDAIAVAEGWPDLALLPTFVARPTVILAAVGGAWAFGHATTAETACRAAVIATWGVTLVQAALLRLRLARRHGAGPRRFDLGLWARVTAPMFVTDAFVVLFGAVDVLIVGRWTTPEQVAVYFATIKTLTLVHFVLFAAKVASAERFATFWHAGAHADLARFARTVARWTFWASLAAVVIVLVVGRPLLALFGPGFTEGFPILFVLAIGVLARASVGPAETLLTMAGQQSAPALVYGLTFAVSLVANAVLVPFHGIWGAAVATTGAMIFEAVLLAVVVRRRFGLRVFVLAPEAGSGDEPPKGTAAP